MKNHPRLYITCSRLAITAFTLLGAFLLRPDSASAQGCGGALSTSKGNLIGSAAGGAAGGLLGNQFGSGAGKGVMTGLGVVGGALAGGYAGRSIEGCEHAPQRTAPQSASRAPQSAAAAPARTARSEPRTCRSVISQAVIDGREQQVEGVACLDADGVWRTASGPAAEQAAAADLVLRTQQRLRDQGFYVRDNVDGHWGPATSAALRNFQRANGMASTGQLDVPTRTALGLDPAPLAQPVAQAQPVAPSDQSVQAGPVQTGAVQRAATPAAAAPSSAGE
jgi:surface antigen